ncbi:MAG: hypothetical protein JKY95_03925 [Planctomycetaceae bacterium]|nr:hypothetical protein [Planctomycetaceae bacterium]
MRNQPHSQWQVIDSTANQRDEAWDLDRRTGLRTAALWLGVCLLLSLIGLRLYDVKANHQSDFLENANPTTEQTEPIPAMDGQIFSSDGLLLAYDDQILGLAVHYRWLESPPNPRWWKQQARKRLKKSEHHNPQALEQAQAEVLEQQEKLWKRLSLLSGLTVEQIAEKRQSIQKRVERIAKAVQKNQQARLETISETNDSDSTEKSIWFKIWELAKSELTQPPRRTNKDPIIIREELDYHRLIEQLSTEDVAEVESHRADYPGTLIVTKTSRVYPKGSFAAHVIGIRREIRDDQIQKRKKELQTDDPLSYQPGDRLGQFGVERTYNITLRGLAGSRTLKRNRRGEILEKTTTRDSRSGNNLVLTLDSRLQETAEELLDQLIPVEQSLVPPLPLGQPSQEKPEPVGGAILVMNVHSGELLAAASAPRPNLSLMSSGDAAYWKQINGDNRSPLLSRITQMTFAPGSTFKPLTAIALCESQGIPIEPFDCQGFLDTPNSHRCNIFRIAGVGHGEINLVNALARSCNVYFFNAARKMGPENLVSWCKEFEFGQSTAVDLPFERSGHIPSPADNNPESNYHWYPGDNLGVAIGQSYLSVTPLQMVKLIAAIANGGELVNPHVVSRIQPGEENDQLALDQLAVPEKPSRRLPISPGVLAEIREGLQQAVESTGGTAHKTVAMKQVAIAGKTGTAQTGLDRPSHAWFFGYAPAENPRYAFVVLLEQGGSGGTDAGPIAKKIVQRLLELNLIESQQQTVNTISLN